MTKENKKMPDKTIYVGLFSQPPNPTSSTDATFALNVATGSNHWPNDALVTATLDGGMTTLSSPGGNNSAVFTYTGLSVGDHTWHASVTGTNIFPGDNDPGFDFAWTIVAP